MDDKLLEEKFKVSDDRIDDHEIRIRELEKNSTEQRILSMEIQKNQIELKNLILENDRKSIERNDKNQEKMDKVFDTVLEVFKNKNKVENEVIIESSKTKNTMNINNNKQMWIQIASIIGIISAILLAIFK